MSEVVMEKLSERERQGLGHLRQAQELGVSLAEYCRTSDLDRDLWYRVKQKLVRKGLAKKGEIRNLSKRVTATKVTPPKRRPTFARVKIAVSPAHAVLAAPAVELPAAMSAPVTCRIVHPSGWVLECGTFPQASWLASVLAGQRP